MKVVCIKSHQSVMYLNDYPLSVGKYKYEPLVVGKIYDIFLHDSAFGYYINGYWENRSYFVELSEHREKQLNKLGI